jgi:hypothetical protein
MKNIFLLILPIFMFWSCDDFLDVEPKGKSIPTTVEDYELMMQSTSFAIGNSYYMDPDIYVTAEDLPSIGVSNLNAYKWAENQYFMTDPDKDWDGIYKKMYYCNHIIGDIDGAPSNNDDENLRRIVKGQAYAQRAHMYFWLVNSYAKHFDAATKDTDLGVPKVIKADLNQKLARASVGEIYALMEEDLQMAKDLVPDAETKKRNFRASKISIDALMAKIELYKGNFSTALSMANSVIDAWGESFNDLNAFSSQQEYINSYAENIQFYGNPEFIWYAGTTHRPSGTHAGDLAYLSNELEGLYVNDDLRYEYFTASVTNEGQTFPEGRRRYINWYAKNLTASIAEMYLIRAECYARSGDGANISKAMDDVNTVRKYRFKTGSSYELSAANLTDALKIVKEERRREFACSGLNWYDLRRYQAYGDAVPTFSRMVDGENFSLAPGSNRYTMAIPEFTRAMNSLLEQNPR